MSEQQFKITSPFSICFGMAGLLPLLKKKKKEKKKWPKGMNQKGAPSEATPKKDVVSNR